jgi:hypothetical protein
VTASTDLDLARRITRVEDTLEIQQLPIRYALAVDQRDVGEWVSLFDPDVAVSRGVTGRDALREFITPLLGRFYRSIHQIVGHRVEFLDDTHARGNVYCRAEHEVGERWIVMAIRYDDRYVKVDGQWFFRGRKERHWYAAGVDEHPQLVGFDSWGEPGAPPELPQHAPSWLAFWAGGNAEAFTQAPAHG